MAFFNGKLVCSRFLKKGFRFSSDLMAAENQVYEETRDLQEFSSIDLYTLRIRAVRNLIDESDEYDDVGEVNIVMRDVHIMLTMKQLQLLHGLRPLMLSTLLYPITQKLSLNTPV